MKRAPADDYLDQLALLVTWLDALEPDDFPRRSALAGWDVRTLLGHVVLVHEGMARALATRTTEPALPLHEYVRAYRRDVAALEAKTRAVTADRPIAALIDRLRDTDALTAVVAGVGDRTVLTAGRGPVTVRDWIVGRVVEVVVHSDDFSRSLPDREPVPLHRAALATSVRALAEILAAQAPGRSVEVRIPPFVAVQAVAGPRHTRGTPPNVAETDALTWLRVATGRADFAAAVADGRIRASGNRADLAPYLPVLS